jgi:hypothetical protein
MSSIELVKKANVQEANVSAWIEIDGWEDTTHEVSILWRVEDGEEHFSLNLTPKTGHDPVAAEVSFDEVQSVRHEQHSYPYIAPKVGHAATVFALGIPEAA